MAEGEKTRKEEFKTKARKEERKKSILSTFFLSTRRLPQVSPFFTFFKTTVKRSGLMRTKEVAASKGRLVGAKGKSQKAALEVVNAKNEACGGEFGLLQELMRTRDEKEGKRGEKYLHHIFFQPAQVENVHIDIVGTFVPTVGLDD